MFYCFTISGDGTRENPRIQRLLTKERNHFAYLKVSSMSEERVEKISQVYKTLKTALKNSHKGFFDFSKGEIPLVWDSWTDTFYNTQGTVIGKGKWGTSHSEGDKTFWSNVDLMQQKAIETAKRLGY